MATNKIFVVLTIICVFKCCTSLNNGVALTPPMAWLTWERFRCNTDCVNDPENCISEHLIKVMADRMASDGYLQAGYEYVMTDDCWLSKKRDANGKLQPDPTRFPSGIPALVDYVHSKGLKFGIYEDYGLFTCGGYPGSLEHMQLDAQTFAEWKVDYLKFDGCFSDPLSMDKGYPEMTNYLNQTNRQMVFSCEWPFYQNTIKKKPDYPKVAKSCNLWRNYDDIQDSWESLYKVYDWHIKHYDEIAPVQGPGAWNDPDMLIIGNFGLSYGQSQAQMAIWSIWAAPLIMSVDLRTISDWAKDILLNDQMIAINQDKLGIMGKKILEKNSVDILSKPLSGDYNAFVFLYAKTDGTPIEVVVSLNDLGLTKYTAYNLYESFSAKLIGTYKNGDNFNCTVNPSGSVFAFWAQPVQAINGRIPDPLPKVNLRKILNEIQ